MTSLYYIVLKRQVPKNLIFQCALRLNEPAPFKLLDNQTSTLTWPEANNLQS